MIIAEKSIVYLGIVLFPFVGWLVNFLFFKNNFQGGSKIATLGMWFGLLNALIAWAIGLPFSKNNACCGFIANEISWLMATLILFVSAIVHHFSLSYMAGDRNYRRYFLLLGLITVSTLLMVASDHVILLIIFWSLSNLILTLLMLHKSQWTAAKNSALLAGKTFVLGLLFLSISLVLLSHELGTLSLDLIVKNSEHLSVFVRRTALFLIMLTAFTQSGCWPFHTWLISSLNSPTPVSALMHAGLVNGGGLLLARFSPIFLHEGFILNVLFFFASATLILGGIWKLLQSDIKRMLACSTMTQMGFMMMQCSLGFFSAALAHLCWHGLFKSFLFLRSGSTIGEHRGTNEQKVSRVPTFFLSSLCGFIGVMGFIFGTDLAPDYLNTTSVLLFFCWLASTQLAHTLLEKKQGLFVFLAGSFICFLTGSLYGLTVHLIEFTIDPLQISQPQPLNMIHLIVIMAILCIWIGLNLKPFTKHEGKGWWRRFYVTMLNASQPAVKTGTFNRNGYKF